MLFLPCPAAAVPVSAGMIVAVPVELVASPLRNGGGLDESDLSALVIGGTEKIRTGGGLVFLKVVAVAEAEVTRGGRVRAAGRPFLRDAGAGGGLAGGQGRAGGDRRHRGARGPGRKIRQGA